MRKLNKLNHETVGKSLQAYACYCGCQCILGINTQSSKANSSAGK